MMNFFTKILQLARFMGFFRTRNSHAHKRISLYNSIDYALEKKKPVLAPKSYSGYKSTMGFIKTAIIELKYKNIPVSKIKRYEVKMILEKVAQNRKASNLSYNKYLDHFRAVLGELVQWDIIEFNPANHIKYKPTSEVRANIPPTKEQHIIIKNHLEKYHFYFYNFIASIYHTGIRPEELLQIKLSMVDLKKQEITLPPEITKTDIERVVPLNPHYYELLSSMDFESLPKSFYLFGSFRKPGEGNVGNYIDFIPAPTKIKRDTATKRWKRIVKSHLGIDVNMYSYKKLGANDKILAGMSVDSLKELYGHTSQTTTLKYITIMQEIHKKQVLSFSPNF